MHRLIELLAVLDVRPALTYAQLRELVPAYKTRYDASIASGRTKDDALKDFYGLVADDLTHLRAAGTRIEERGHVGEAKTLHRHGDWAMKPLHLEPMEVLALYLAMRAWGAGPRTGGAATAIARSTEVIAGAGAGSAIPFAGLGDVATAAVGLTSASLAALAEAVDGDRVITFDYRTSGAADVQRRWVDPWGLVRCWGRAYLVGHDRTRRDVRVFRSSRVDGDLRVATDAETASLGGPRFTSMPRGADLESYVFSVLPARDAEVWVRSAVASRFGHEFRDTAERVGASDDNGWVAFRLRFWDAKWFAGVLRQYSDDLDVVHPDDVRGLVEEGLAAVADQVAAVLAGET